jgi:decaprenylphospho-beta-D-erythro-pentofuranosid-2-ulose 2-reductase
VTDALDRPASVVVLGATSEIARSVVRALRSPALYRLVLAGRPSDERDEVVAEFAAVPVVEVHDLDASDATTHEQLLAEVFAAGDVDLVVVAFGVLGDQRAQELDPDLAVAAAQVNYVGALSVSLRSARHLREQGHGVLVVISSVAGERARRSNFVYGSSKAGIDALATGLSYALEGSGARAMVVRPGFVRTRMTAHLPEAPLAVGPDDVAREIVRGLRRRAVVVYAPAALRWVMLGLRHVPRAAFRRLPL